MSTNPFPNMEPRLDKVRVLTLNLWGLSGVWADRRSVLIAGFRALQTDLVAMQEVIKNDEYDQVITPPLKNQTFGASAPLARSQSIDFVVRPGSMTT